MTEEIRNKVLDILEELCGDEIVKEDPDINLLEEGLIDSLDYITLLVDIQEEIGVIMSPTEFTREQMDTPARIVYEVGRKLEKQGR